MIGAYNPAFDVSTVPNPVKVTLEKPSVPPVPKVGSQEAEQNVLKQQAQPTSVSVKKQKPVAKTKSGKSETAFVRDFPRELLSVVRASFPELTNQTDAMVAFVLCHLGADADEALPTYRAPEHIKEAVRRVLTVSDDTGVQALGTSMKQLRTKLNAMSDQLLRLQMLSAYNITVSTGLHAPGRVHSGDDLKLGHENVLTTTYAALDEFPQYKQIVTDHEGRPHRKRERRL